MLDVVFYSDLKGLHCSTTNMLYAFTGEFSLVHIWKGIERFLFHKCAKMKMQARDGKTYFIRILGAICKQANVTVLARVGRPCIE